MDGVAIVGAGLGGLTLAAALRGHSFPVEVLSAGIDGNLDRGLCVWGGALAALDRIGLGSPALARGAPVERVRLWSGGGRLLLEVSERESPGTVGSLAIRTSELMNVLRKACSGVPISTGRRVIGYAEDEHGVVLALHGGWAIRTPVVVGADGLSSAIRAQSLDDGPAEYSGDSVWEGIAPGPAWLTSGTLDLYWGSYGLRGGAMAVDRGGGGWAWWVDLQTGVGGPRQPHPWKPELLELLGDIHGPLPAMVEATPEDAIRRTDVLARRRALAAADGRVTLLGDASHPLPVTLRVGGSLAIEDGVALAEALIGETHPVEAFRRYERLRAPRIAWTGRSLWRLHAIESRFIPTAARARDAWIRRLPPDAVRRFLSRILISRD